MARNMYGATSADFTLTSGGRVVPGATLTIWSARTGGTQITDLLDVDSVATTTVTSDADGSIVYYGPNNDKTVHWADSGVGSRIAIRPVDITGDPPVLSIGTVGTGAAAANLTGTSEAPVLNLTLPTAGANGVDTAAIQDAAVTYAKLGSDVRIGNLLTANQASGTDTLSATTGFTALYSTLASATSVYAQGSRSLEVTATSTSFAGFNIGGDQTYGTIPVVGGDVYTFIAKVYSAASTDGVTPIIYWWTSAGNVAASTAQTTGTEVALAASWKQLALTATAPANAAFASIRVRADASHASGIVWNADALSFHRGAGGTFALPGTVVPGTSRIAVNNAVDLSGTGSPEGVVTAAPGSTWLQTDATTDVKGWIRWMKATGTGNTGWVAGPEADTGWRLVSSWDTAGTVTGAAFGTGWEPRTGVAGQFLVRRRGAAIDLVVSQIQTNASSPSAAIFASLTGFTPTYTAVAAVSAAATCPLEFTGSGLKRAGSQSIASGVAAYSISVTASTAVAWPASLPGSAA